LSYSKAVTGWFRVTALAASVAALALVGPAFASAATFGKRDLSVGMSGADVLALQHDLTAIGFSTPATGTYSRATMREIKLFQRKYKLQVDGVAGPLTFKKLQSMLSSANHITETAEVSGAADVATTAQTQTVPAADSLPSADSGGVGFAPTPESSSEVNATINPLTGLAVPAPGTPEAIVNVIDAANEIAFLPYIYGGGHSNYVTTASGAVKLEAGYDCSGSVSFALHGGGFLADPLDSTQFAAYGEPGVGNWISIYTDPGYHTYMEVAGLWFDTAAQSANNGDDRWSTTKIAEPGQSFSVHHPAGW